MTENVGIYVPDCRQCHQGALKRCRWGFCVFSLDFRSVVGVGVIFGHDVLLLGGPKRQNTLWVFTPPTCFGTSCCSVLLFCIVPHRGTMAWHFADERASVKCLHVPATSSEALSASNDVAGIWSRFSVTSTSVMWAWAWQGVVMAIGLAVWWCHRTCGRGRWVLCCQRSGTEKVM